MKTVGVRELKTNFSAHLRDVARGDVILVTDHGRVIAELRRPRAESKPSLTPDALRRARLVDRGLLRQAPPAGTPGWKSTLPRLLKKGTAQQVLDADREEHPV